MRIYFDTEFIEDGKTIDLISIGLVREDGETYYAESFEADLTKANDWVKENVLVHLKGDGKPRKQIAAEILEFVGQSPEFWAYYAAYDWVALCQLYGCMIDLPKGWPMFCRDIIQLAKERGNPQLPEQNSTEHHALADALWNREAHDFLLTRPVELVHSPNTVIVELNPVPAEGALSGHVVLQFGEYRLAACTVSIPSGGRFDVRAEYVMQVHSPAEVDSEDGDWVRADYEEPHEMIRLFNLPKLAYKDGLIYTVEPVQ